MTDYQILIIGLLLVIAVLVGLCAWGIWRGVWRSDARGKQPGDEYPRSRYEEDWG